MFDTDILDWWENHQHLGLTQRFTTFFEQVLLQEISDRVVIFVDEIDTVLSVDFADDFFIAIRYFHQNRAQNPDLHRLSFVLLGVAAPGDLIRNQQRTPFNIGQPIDLRGFSVAEVQPLGAGLAQLLAISESQALAVLEAVLHWTGGQPFLTQKVCQFMTTTDSRPAPGEELAWVSTLVQEKIIDRWEAQDTPPHLSTIRDRLTRSKEKTARLLGLYQNLLEQGDLPADDRPEQVELRLTGLVVKRDGRLQVFNHIYQSVFKRSWVVQALRDLRPYGDAIQEWLSSGRQDESRLLRGQALQEARQWAEGKSLGDDDRLFLDASQEIERREAELRFDAEREANRILTAARDDAESQLQDVRNQLEDLKAQLVALEQEKVIASQELDQAKQIVQTVAQLRFTTGGRVQAGGGIYLKRSADEELLQACQQGIFTYVLTSRQMGQSSLMTHAAEQLRSLQIQPIMIDLQSFGVQMTADQWYLGLLIDMEAQLMLDTDILDWWGEHQHLGLTQRFINFFEQVLLKEITGQVVIFVDEIDVVLSLDFTDDFFLAIRYFHQNRAHNPDLYRLSFVLLGFAAPGDLIRNQQRTPFNIGQPIELRGFTSAEIQPLGNRLAQYWKISELQAFSVLEAVLEWTGGHPFLTQKVCQIMVASGSPPAIGSELAWVSALVKQHIIDRWEEQDTPPHLSTIRDRLTRSKEKTTRLLGLYQQLLEQGDLPIDDRPEQLELRMTGLVVKQDGRLQVFNRIYQEVFNQAWVQQALADFRPYGDALQEWLNSGRQDESRLLRGQVLQEARQWAEGKSLGDNDRRFLDASLEFARQEAEAKQLEEEAKLRDLEIQLQEITVLLEINKQQFLDASLEMERRDAELQLEAERKANRILTVARDRAESQLRDARNHLEDLKAQLLALEQEKVIASQELE